MTAGGPPIPPKPLGAVLGSKGPVVELFVDLACPPSKRLFTTVYGQVRKSGPPAQFVLYNVVQPWHPQSTVMHEAALAVKEIGPAQFWPYMAAVFERQDQFLDSAVVSLSRVDLAQRLAAIAEEACGVPAAQVERMLRVTKEGNAGNEVTQLVKWHVKHHRARGVHVTPTVFTHGIETPQISSGSTAQEWAAFLNEVAGA